MALIKCSNCGQIVSDKAEICIHCGQKLNEILKKKEFSTEESNE